MANRIEQAIATYASNRSAESLARLEVAFVESLVLVPVSGSGNPDRDGTSVVSVICLKTLAGDGSIPAFTTVNQLLQWKPEGHRYAELTGLALIQMAIGMPEIESIVVNVAGTPRGAIPRSEFGRLGRTN